MQRDKKKVQWSVQCAPLSFGKTNLQLGICEGQKTEVFRRPKITYFFDR